MPQQAPTSMNVIAAAVADLLAAQGVVDRTRILITARRDVPHLAADRDIVIRIGGEVPDRAAIDGGGRFNNVRTRRLEITARTRVNLDEVGRDDAHILDPSLGHIAFEDAVCDAVESLLVVDGNQNVLSWGPLRLGPLSDIEEEKRDRERDRTKGWLESRWQAEVIYQRALNTSRI